MSSSKGGYRRNQQRYRNDKTKPKVGDKGREILEQIDENNPVIKMFRECAVELDAKHDRYERIVKLSRDITIESKRIIFLLHNTDADKESKRDIVLKEAVLRLNILAENNFKLIATELETQDSYQYLRAYTAALQEYIEALTLYHYLRDGSIEKWQNVDNTFWYTLTKSEESDDSCVRDVKLLFPATEYILGLADFTGELMRKCINNLGSGNIEDCFKICNFVKDIYTGFLSVNNAGHKEIGRKLYVLKQSLAKMELVCYNIRVRGSEIPKHMLANVINTNTEINNEEDEGFY